MKKMATIILVMASLSLTLTADVCFAKKQKYMICVAEKVEGKNVILKCKSKDTKKIEVGAKYKLKKELGGC